MIYKGWYIVKKQPTEVVAGKKTFIGLWLECLPMAWEIGGSIPGHVISKTKKNGIWYLLA